jgi:hypothetical protein
MSSKGKKGEFKEAPKEAPKKVEPKKEEPLPEGGSMMDDLAKRQAFKKFSYRGEDITKLLAMDIDNLS